MSQQSIFIADGTGAGNVANVNTTTPITSDPGLVVRPIDPAEGATGAAIPTTALLLGASDGTNLQQLLVESASNRNLRVGLFNGANEASVSAAGALKVDGSSFTQPVSGTVTANIGTTNGLALDTTLAKLTIAQGTALGSNTQALIGGSVTTAAPTYTTGQISPLSLTTAGALRVDASATSSFNNASIGTNGSAIPTSSTQIGGSDGTNLRQLATDTSGVLYTATVAQAIAKARVTGLVGVFFGEITTAATTRVGVLATGFTDQTAGAQRSVNSGSANDTSAGTGARTVKITYYTVSGSTISGPSTETITMNGTTAVNTVATNICYIEKIEVVTVGSGNTNAGAIQLFSTTAGGGTVIASIATGDNITKYAHHYVASGKACMVYDIYGQNDAASGNNPRIQLAVVDPTATTNAETQAFAFRVDGRSGFVFNSTVPLVVQGPARIRAYVTPANNPSQVTTVDFKYIEV